MSPNDCFTMPYTVASPRPVPRPGGFVVKNGSKARASVARVHSGAGIAHRQSHVVAGGESAPTTPASRRRRAPLGRRGGVRRLDRERSAVRRLHRVARVEREIHQHLPQLPGVGVDGRRFGVEARDDLDALADGRPHHVQRFLDDRVHVEHRGRQELLAAEREELPGERGRAIGRARDSREMLG